MPSFHETFIFNWCFTFHLMNNFTFQLMYNFTFQLINNFTFQPMNNFTFQLINTISLMLQIPSNEISVFLFMPHIPSDKKMVHNFCLWLSEKQSFYSCLASHYTKGYNALLKIHFKNLNITVKKYDSNVKKYHLQMKKSKNRQVTNQ